MKTKSKTTRTSAKICPATMPVSRSSTNSVARKGRTSASGSSKTNDRARSSKPSRVSGAGGHGECDTHPCSAASKVSKRGQRNLGAQTTYASLASTSAAPRKQSSRAGNKAGKISPRANTVPKTMHNAPAATICDGHTTADNQPVVAVVTSSAFQNNTDAHRRHERAPYASHPMPSDQRDAVASINDAWRKRQGIVRAMTRLSLQAQATLRSGRDREEAAKHYATVAKDPAHIDYPIIAPYLEAQQPLARHRGDYEKGLVKLVKQLPIYKWAQGVSGLGDVSLAGLIGECSGYNMETDELWSIGQMKSVSAVWKRMGVAVVGGIRQQRVKGEAALEHGYVAERRSVLWNIGECIVKAQWRKENTVHAYGKLYGEIKAELQDRNDAGDFASAALAIAERMKKAGSKPNPENVAGRLTPMHINNRAKRHVTKRLLRDLFVEWRRLDAEARGETYAPIAEAA